MIKLVNSLLLIIVFSCEPVSKDVFLDKVEKTKEKIEKEIKIKLENNEVGEKILSDKIFYFVGKPYFIEGVEYIPEENYSYNKEGLATYYDKELHNTRTSNNDYNKVTELLGRHKTLPIPSIVKITNLENGLSLTIKIIDRHEDNSAIIQVSRKSSQLLKFYKNKIARVRIEILSDPSKQMKIVIESINQSNFNETVISAPTETVSITDIIIDEDNKKKSANISPLEVGFSKITDEKFFLKVFNFKTYDEAKSIYLDLELEHKFTTQNDEGSYSLILGPLNNIEANNLVLSFIAKGYNKTEFFLE